MDHTQFITCHDRFQLFLFLQHSLAFFYCNFYHIVVWWSRLYDVLFRFYAIFAFLVSHVHVILFILTMLLWLASQKAGRTASNGFKSENLMCGTTDVLPLTRFVHVRICLVNRVVSIMKYLCTSVLSDSTESIVRGVSQELFYRTRRTSHRCKVDLWQAL